MFYHFATGAESGCWLRNDMLKDKPKHHNHKQKERKKNEIVFVFAHMFWQYICKSVIIVFCE